MSGADREEFEVLDQDTCLTLLGGGGIGRVGVTLNALPAIFPVAYQMVDGQIMFYTGVGTKLSAALSGAVVAFEVDRSDPATRAGWSVLAIGVARVSAEDTDRRAAELAQLQPWAPGDRPHLVVLRPEQVSGRRLRGAAESP